MHRHACNLLLLITVLCSSQVYSEVAEPPFVDASIQFDSGELSLSGKWAFIRNAWVPLEDLRAEKLTFETINVPSFLSDTASSVEEKLLFAHGYATYLVDIRNLEGLFIHPAFTARHINDAWQAWWLEGNDPPVLLGEAGRIGRSKSEEIAAKDTNILSLPHDAKDGRLVIYLSSFHHARGGIFGHIEIKEQESILKFITADLASRAFLTGLGLYVVIQNLAFFFQRPKETVLLLLAVFAFTGMLRSALASGYVDYFLNLSSLSNHLIRVEYILVPWPAVAALHYFLALFPIRYGKQIITSAYLLLIVISIITFLLSIELVSALLPYYQVSMLIFAAFCIGIIVNGVIRRMPDSKLVMHSFFPILLATFNDIYASNSAGYNLYIVEYALFIFLFLQTQIQAVHYVKALETSEHLTHNLQNEVARKTLQLSERNAELEEKTLHLKAKHDEAKLLSETDHLTGLFNRKTLEHRSNVLFEIGTYLGQPLSVIMMDLDHFKEINDKYGHLVGDECLIFLASYLKGFNLRKRDLIARYGGEEIIVILPDTALKSAVEIANDICVGIKKHPISGDHEDIYLAASFGVADLASTNAISIRHLISCADQALYKAKQNGRDRVEVY